MYYVQNCETKCLSFSLQALIVPVNNEFVKCFDEFVKNKLPDGKLLSGWRQTVSVSKE